jgi:hypothetical protein
MNEEPQFQIADLNLGQWLGRREAFGLAAARCTAAEIETLRLIREQRIYRNRRKTWADFCTLDLKVSRRWVDRAIALLAAYGPAFFHISLVTHIGPRDYRLIAPHVSDAGIHIDGNVVALLPENSQEISAAITELLKRIEPKQPKPVTIGDAMKRCQTFAAALEAVPQELDEEQKTDLAAAICEIRRLASRLGVEITG